MTIRDWESRRTHAAWGTGSGSPALMVLTCVVINVIALIVIVVINTTVNEDGDNDYSDGFAWSVMTPAPSIGLLWALIDIAVCHFSVLHPIYYLVESTLLTAISLILGSMSIGFYAWDAAGGSWVPGIFILFAGVVYIAIMAISARLVHKQRTRPQSAGTV